MKLNDSLNSLSQGQGPLMDQGGPPAGGGQGGPGIDTPAEQQALDLLTQGAQLIRQAATVEPSIRPLVDQHLERAFLDIMTAWGAGEQAKLALKQAKMQRDQQRAGRLGGPPTPPPMSGEGGSPPPMPGGGPPMPGGGSNF